MVYLRNQPVGTDDLSVSQPILLANTNQADDTMAIDHFQFSDTTANNGKHLQSHYVERLGPTIPTTVADEGALYSKLATIAAPFTAQTELFWRSENNGAEIQLTKDFPALVGSNGSTFLAGGFIIKWGAFSMANGQSTTPPQSFVTQFPTNVFSIVITPASNNANNYASYAGQTLTGFTPFRANTSGAVFYTYIAIGN